MRLHKICLTVVLLISMFQSSSIWAQKPLSKKRLILRPPANSGFAGPRGKNLTKSDTSIKASDVESFVKKRLGRAGRSTDIRLSSTRNLSTGKLMTKSRGIQFSGQLETVGEVPTEWQNGFAWGREENQALLLVFVNAAHEPGVPIYGLEPGDWVAVMGAARSSASFSKDNGNKKAQGIIGLLGSGASITTAALGAPEVSKYIEKGKRFCY